MKPKAVHEFVLIEGLHGSGQAAGLMPGHHIESGTGGMGVCLTGVGDLMANSATTSATSAALANFVRAKAGISH